ncbi:hypothetical protein [Marinobacter vinifirmus]|nr:hypothetical protein [Marinobacter vinifirmus]
MKPLTEKQYIGALEKMKKSPRDRVGALGELGVTGLGAAAGAALSGAAAGAAGAATLAGSSTLGSILGGVFITTTPVGWVVGSVAAGACIGFAVSKMVRSGGRADEYRVHSMKELEVCIKKLRAKSRSGVSFEEQFHQVITGIQHLVVNGRLSQEKSTELIVRIEQRKIAIEEAFEIIGQLAGAKA